MIVLGTSTPKKLLFYQRARFLFADTTKCAAGIFVAGSRDTGET